MATKTICDRCGNEIERNEDGDLAVTKLEISSQVADLEGDISTDELIDADLCEECGVAIRKALVDLGIA